MTTLSAFMIGLHETGQVVVPVGGPEREPPGALARACALAEASARRAAPGTAPAAEPGALIWGFTMLFQAARYLVHRDLSAELLAAAFAEAGPQSRDPATVFAVDIGLRHLPTIATWARAAAAHDPLVAGLTTVGGAWPLSSVGMPGTTGGEIAPLFSHPTVLALYVDRIIAHDAAERAHDPRLRVALAAALGGHAAHAPAVAAALAAATHADSPPVTASATSGTKATP